MAGIVYVFVAFCSLFHTTNTVNEATNGESVNMFAIELLRATVYKMELDD